MLIKKLIPVVLLAVFAGCDYVEVPTPAGGQNSGGGGGGNTTHRKVLVEEITGHFCPTCPAGALALEAAYNLYQDSMILVAIHTGYFAEPVAVHGLPNGAPAGSFTEYFGTPEGDQYGPVFQMGQSAPRCMYNRTGFLSGNYDMHPNDCASALDTILNRPQSLDFEITHSYNASTRELTFAANGNFLTSGGSSGDSYNLVIYLTEDSLTGWQVNGTQYQQNYVFNHVLRACVNTPGSITGSTIHSGTTIAGDTLAYALPGGYTVSTGVNATHADLVVFVYNTVTKEVMQAEKVALIE